LSILAAYPPKKSPILSFVGVYDVSFYRAIGSTSGRHRRHGCKIRNRTRGRDSSNPACPVGPRRINAQARSTLTWITLALSRPTSA